MRFQCEECLNREYHDIEGSGTDERGDFTAYVCTCGHITKIYDEEL